MDLDPETVKKLDPLTLTNTITVSALVGVLIRKGILTDAELVQEIRALRAKIGIAERAQREGEK